MKYLFFFFGCMIANNSFGQEKDCSNYEFFRQDTLCQILGSLKSYGRYWVLDSNGSNGARALLADRVFDAFPKNKIQFFIIEPYLGKPNAESEFEGKRYLKYILSRSLDGVTYLTLVIVVEKRTGTILSTLFAISN